MELQNLQKIYVLLSGFAAQKQLVGDALFPVYYALATQERIA
jgi:hypothetical protein